MDIWPTQFRKDPRSQSHESIAIWIGSIHYRVTRRVLQLWRLQERAGGNPGRLWSYRRICIWSQAQAIRRQDTPHHPHQELSHMDTLEHVRCHEQLHARGDFHASRRALDTSTTSQSTDTMWCHHLQIQNGKDGSKSLAKVSRCQHRLSRGYSVGNISTTVWHRAREAEVLRERQSSRQNGIPRT